MNNLDLEKLINKKINSNTINDYTPNGLQIEGKKNVNKIITGVTACQALLNKAILYQADAIIVHHGYFWKNESYIIHGIKRLRLKTILANNINLYAWHLPLDLDSDIGNNVQLAKILSIRITGNLNKLVLKGEIENPMSGEELHLMIKKKLNNKTLYFNNNNFKKIKKIAWCTGNGQNFTELVAKSNIDAFITGEISENTVHIAKEYELNFYAAGHHSTEKGGIISLGNWLSKNYNLNVTFIDIFNPI